jgi:hypothetical protein
MTSTVQTLSPLAFRRAWAPTPHVIPPAPPEAANSNQLSSKSLGVWRLTRPDPPPPRRPGACRDDLRIYLAADGPLKFAR